MSLSNSSAKKNANEESKNENKSGIQDEYQKSENFIDYGVFNIRKHH